MLLGCAICLPAQQTATPSPLPASDEEGCKDSPLLSRIAKCVIIQCSTKENDDFEIWAGVSADQTPVKKDLEGPIEAIYYLCPAGVTASSITKHQEAAIKEKGYKILFSGADGEDNPLVAGQNGKEWMQVSTYTYEDKIAYIQTAVRSDDPDVETPENWMEEFARYGRAPIYGIAFEAGKATLTADSAKALGELAAFLKKEATLSIRVEGHTDASGAKAVNLTTSKERAAAVEAWLVAHGIDKSRLKAEGLGDAHPVTENETEEGRAKNRRIEVVKQ